jgi:hypothetical protein
VRTFVKDYIEQREKEWRLRGFTWRGGDGEGKADEKGREE